MEVTTSNSEKELMPLIPSEYYKRMRPEYFSDSEVIYEIPLTEELFDLQMDLLSTKKLQSAFEAFIVDLVLRLITPNIKPQTGPDGGGDGKVDAETYETSTDISDKWFSEKEGAKNNEKWAFAISCKAQWKPKIESDVQKIAETDRGYTRILFFSNQYIKSSVRANIEKDLTTKFGIKVDIFDRLWCKQAVFQQNCLDSALTKLGFSNDYKKCTRKIGPMDRCRMERLEEIEKSILCPITGLNTGYIDNLLKACILSRELNRPRTEVEGRFYRALNECEKHGTPQQEFNIIYDYAWTLYFWFDDFEKTYEKYLILKTFIDEDCTVYRLEKFTNLFSILRTAKESGYIENEIIQNEIKYINNLKEIFSKDTSKNACYLFICLRIQIWEIMYHIHEKSYIKDDLLKLRPLLLEAVSCRDISFESQYEIIEMLSQKIEDSSEFDDIVDEMAEVIAKQRSEVAAAKVRLARAEVHIDKKRWKEAIRQLSFCVYAFEKEEYIDELIKSSGLMGGALWELRLPYSSEAYLLKSVYFLIQKFRATGQIPHILITSFKKLCEIELMLGRLVMYLNWYHLMMILSNDSNYNTKPNFVNMNAIADSAWMCRFATSNIPEKIISKLPSMLERLGFCICSEYFKYILGYEEECDNDFLSFMKGENDKNIFIKQPIFEQFLSDLNVSCDGDTYLQTTVNSFTFRIEYKNDYFIQQISEILLASMESLLSTYENFEIIPIHNNIIIKIILSSNDNDIKQLDNNRYEFRINVQTFTEKIFWNCLVKFIAFSFTKNAVIKCDIVTLLEQKQYGERMIDRVAVIQHNKQIVDGILGDNCKYRIEDWILPTDKIYLNKNKQEKKNLPNIIYKNEKQSNITSYLLNQDMSIWNNAGWNGCLVATDPFSPPIFGLIFENQEIGRKIVNEWKQVSTEFYSPIKIFIIKGIDANNPYWYRVSIIPSFIKPKDNPQKYISLACRNHTMTPKDNKNLDLLESEYKKFGTCLLMPISPDRYKNVTIQEEDLLYSIELSNLYFYNAYEIKWGDEAVFSLKYDDNPYIPEQYINNAPILNVLEHLKNIVKK